MQSASAPALSLLATGAEQRGDSRRVFTEVSHNCDSGVKQERVSGFCC
jgi:hypothetical protein